MSLERSIKSKILENTEKYTAKFFRIKKEKENLKKF